MKPKELVASAIGRERERAGLSLSALALKADLAKSTLSQLEAGKGNPSIETLWSIASALEIPFSFLFESTTTDFQLIRKKEGNELPSDSAAFSTVLLDKCPPMKRRDLYRIDLVEGAEREAQAHPRDTIEHAFVCDGVVIVGPCGNTQELNSGDYFRYRADQVHSYRALTATATLLLVMETTG